MVQWLVSSSFRLICLYIYLSNLSTTSRMWNKVNYWVEYSWFEFRVFLLLDLIFSTIYLQLGWKEQMDSRHFDLCEVKCKQFRSGFELELRGPFLKSITVAPHALAIYQCLEFDSYVYWSTCPYLPNITTNIRCDRWSIFKRSKLVWLKNFSSPRVVA